MLTRRDVLKTLILAVASDFSEINAQLITKQQAMTNKKSKRIKIQSVNSNFEREPFSKPFGFKGGYVTGLWQNVNLLQSSSGIKKAGLSTQSILWSDPAVYAAHSESGGNAIMYALTEYVMQLIKGREFNNPIELQNEILDEVYEYGIKITGSHTLRKTFVLNALVSLDNAAWMLYAAENEINTFDEMIPEKYRSGRSHHHSQVASIPTFLAGVLHPPFLSHNFFQRRCSLPFDCQLAKVCPPACCQPGLLVIGIRHGPTLNYLCNGAAF